MPTGIYELDMNGIVDAVGPYAVSFMYYCTVPNQGAGSLFCEIKYEDPGGNERSISGNNVSLNNTNDFHTERLIMLERHDPEALFQFRMQSSDPQNIARYSFRLFISTAHTDSIDFWYPYGED